MKVLAACVVAMIVTAGIERGLASQEQTGRPAQRPPRETPLPGEGALQGEPVILDATKPHDKQLTLDIVQVIGCMADGPNNTFMLTSATPPVKGGPPSTSPEAVKAAATKQLGTQKYVLIGVSEWNPVSHRGQKIVVKGMMIKDAKETRVNVTSLQKLADTCTK